MKKNVAILLLLTCTLFVACTKKNTASKTPKVIPTNYVTDVMPLVQTKCAPCHIPAKGGRKLNLDNFEAVKKYSSDMLSRIQLNPTDRGFMPFKNPKLSNEEIAVFKKWIDQGMLEK